MEGQVECEGAQPNFVSGLAALFASFYNFNLQYQEEAACSLEFVQRLDICTFILLFIYFPDYFSFCITLKYIVEKKNNNKKKPSHSLNVHQKTALLMKC